MLLCYLSTSYQYIYWLFFDLSSGYPQFRMFQSIIIIHFLSLMKITILICHGKLHIYLLININNPAILYSRFGILIPGITVRKQNLFIWSLLSTVLKVPPLYEAIHIVRGWFHCWKDFCHEFSGIPLINIIMFSWILWISGNLCSFRVFSSLLERSPKWVTPAPTNIQWASRVW